MTQQEAFEILKMGYNAYITGPAGSGKTFLLQKYIDYLKNNGKSVGITASTGIAATHMNGITIHSFSGLGIKDKVSKYDIDKILKKRFVKKRFENTRVIIIDEISMLSADQFDSLNLICQAFKKNKSAFGGMQIVCSGDLFQLPPIERDGKAVKFVYEANIWKNMDIKICYLEEQYRQKESDELLKLLNHIRKSEIDLAKNILANKNFSEVIFEIEPIKLFTHNVNVDSLNHTELEKINEKENCYAMQSFGNIHVVEALKRGCLSPENLRLKIGAKVMFVKNNFEQGYVNGTLGKITGFDENDNLPVVKTIKGKTIKADLASWIAEEDGKIKAEIKQIPLRLAWAITVHKSQGMNIDIAEIDLSKSFVEGMGYVALSRLRSLAGLKLMGINEMSFLVNKTISEIDQALKEDSEKCVKELSAMPISEKLNKQTKYLNSLPTVFAVRKNNHKEEKTANWEMTHALIKQKIPIALISKAMDFKEETIINHLEKITEKFGIADFEYLKPEEKRFNRIKSAFEQIFEKTQGFKLAQVKEILGEDFSYLELRLARLFIKKFIVIPLP